MSYTTIFIVHQPGPNVLLLVPAGENVLNFGDTDQYEQEHPSALLLFSLTFAACELCI